MSTLDDVQNAMVNVIAPAMYPNTTSSPSIAGSYVSGITVNNGGTGYTIATVTINSSDGNGSGATARANIVGGVIISIDVLNPGIGYTAIPDVVITGDGNNAIATTSISDIDILVGAGDFLKIDVDAGLAARKIFIAVFAVNGMTRNTTRIRREWVDSVIDAATLTATVNDDAVTIGGTITVGQAVMVIVQGTGYSYAALTGDTLDDIATKLAALIPNAVAVGAVITVPNVFDIIARISVRGTSRRVLESQESVFRVRIYAPDYPSRALVGKQIALAFATLADTQGGTDYYLPMPDLISASIKPNRVMEINANEMDNAFVRDYMYLVEYHTVEVKTFQTIADAYAIVTTQVTPITP